MQLDQSRKSRSGGWLEDEAQTRRDQQRGLEQRWLGDNYCKSGGQKGLAQRTTSSKRGASLSSLECRCALVSKPRRAVKPRSGHHGNHLSNIDLQIDRPIQRAMPADTRPCLDVAGCSVLTMQQALSPCYFTLVLSISSGGSPWLYARRHRRLASFVS